MSFWNWFWVVVETFVLVTYLIALFWVVRDLFRDHQLRGWAKALWVLFLIVVPVLTALVYLLARGSGMAQRENQQAQQTKARADAYIRQVAGTSPAEQIATAKELLDAGAIDAAEFDRLKAAALV